MATIPYFGTFYDAMCERPSTFEILTAKELAPREPRQCPICSCCKAVSAGLHRPRTSGSRQRNANCRAYVFGYFGGVPEHVLVDNAGTVVTEQDAYGDGRHRWHGQMLALADTYGFTPRLCRPYRTKTKGKVERFNGYLKGSFCVPLAQQAP